MFHQAIYKTVRSMLTVLLLATSVAFTFTAQAAPTDYDGVWDVYFACEYRLNKGPTFISFRNVVVRNGEGSLSVDTTNSRTTLTMTFENNEVKLRRRGIGLFDTNMDWILKINGVLFDNRAFNLAGIDYRQASGAGLSQGSSECHVGGFLREPAANSLAAKKTKVVAPTVAPAVSVYDGVWKLKMECLSSGTLASPYEEFDLKIIDGKGSATFTTKPADASKISQVEYQVSIQSKTISLIRTMTRVVDTARVWQMKVKDEMMSQTRMQIQAMTVPLFKDDNPATRGVASSCLLVGFR